MIVIIIIIYIVMLIATLNKLTREILFDWMVVSCLLPKADPRLATIENHVFQRVY